MPWMAHIGDHSRNPSYKFNGLVHPRSSAQSVNRLSRFAVVSFLDGQELENWESYSSSSANHFRQILSEGRSRDIGLCEHADVKPKIFEPKLVVLPFGYVSDLINSQSNERQRHQEFKESLKDAIQKSSESSTLDLQMPSVRPKYNKKGVLQVVLEPVKQEALDNYTESIYDVFKEYGLSDQATRFRPGIVVCDLEIKRNKKITKETKRKITSGGIQTRIRSKGSIDKCMPPTQLKFGRFCLTGIDGKVLE